MALYGAKEKGELTRAFSMNAGVLLSHKSVPASQQELMRETHQEVVKGNKNIIASNSISTDNDPKAKTEKENKKQRDWQYLQMLRQSVEEARQALNELIELNNLKLEQAKTDLAKGLAEFENVDLTLNALQDALTHIDNGEELELDENTKLTDKRLEKVIEEYEKETSSTVDRENTALLRSIFKDYALPKYKADKEWLEKWVRLHKDEVDFYSRFGKTLEDLLKEGEDIEHKSPEEQENFIEKVARDSADAEEFEVQKEAQKQELLNQRGQVKSASDLGNGTQPTNAPVPSL